MPSEALVSFRSHTYPRPTCALQAESCHRPACLAQSQRRSTRDVAGTGVDATQTPFGVAASVIASNISDVRVRAFRLSVHNQHHRDMWPRRAPSSRENAHALITLPLFRWGSDGPEYRLGEPDTRQLSTGLESTCLSVRE